MNQKKTRRIARKALQQWSGRRMPSNTIVGPDSDAPRKWNPKFFERCLRSLGLEPLSTPEENEQLFIDMLEGGFTVQDIGIEPPKPSSNHQPPHIIDLFPRFRGAEVEGDVEEFTE